MRVTSGEISGSIDIVSGSRDARERHALAIMPPATKADLVEDPRRTARNLIEQDESTLRELWLRYWANGGEAVEPFELEAYLYGMVELSAFEDEILAQALEDLQPPGKAGRRNN